MIKTDRIVIDIKRHEPDTDVPARAVAGAMVQVRTGMMMGYTGGSCLVIYENTGYPVVWEMQPCELVGERGEFQHLSPVYICPD